MHSTNAAYESRFNGGNDKISGTLSTESQFLPLSPVPASEDDQFRLAFAPDSVRGLVKLPPVLFLVVSILIAAMTGCTSRTTGIPVAAAARAGTYIATLIRSHDPGVVSLHPNPEDERFSLALLLQSNSDRRVVAIASGLRYSEIANGARILADDGKLLWFQWTELSAYDYRSHKLLRRRDLPTVIPRNIESTFTRFSDSQPRADRFLVKTQEFGGSQHYKAAVITPLRLTEPEGVLLTYWTQRGLKGTFVISRIAKDSGKVLWTIETGLADVDQILPDARQLAVIGRLPMVPDKLSEPFLTLIDTRSGTSSTHTLWVRP
jgi:hypothetical protein